MQVFVITSLTVKRYKRKSYSLVIISNIVRLIQNQSRMISTRVVSGPWKTRLEQGRIPNSRTTIEKENQPCTPVTYLRCNSVTIKHQHTTQYKMLQC
jgi:hypothetical protein